MEFTKELKREIILDNYQYPRHKGLKKDDNYLSMHMASDSCIDDITVQAKIEDGIIKDLNFDGVACSISTASTSIMCDMFVGKTIEEAKEIMQNYHNMLFEAEYNSEQLEELNAFNELYKQANRIKCGEIGFNALDKILKESETTNEK